MKRINVRLAGGCGPKSLCLLRWGMGLLMGLLVCGAGVAENKIPFNRLDVNHGLFSNEVTCIYKDRRGFMWFGSSSGLSRFDGYEFRSFRHEVEGVQFSEEYIAKIIETADGYLWITYQDDKISVFDPAENLFFTGEEVTRSLGLPGNVASIFQDEEYNLLFGTEDNRLGKYEYATGTVSYLPVDGEAGKVCDVYCREERLYAVHYSGVLEAIDLEQGTCLWQDVYMSGIEARHYRLFVDMAGEIWLYLNPEDHAGLFRLNPVSREWTEYTTATSPALSSTLIRDIAEDGQGVLWIATDHGGINLLDKRTGYIRCLRNDPFDPLSISQNSVICLYRDDTGIIWTGTYKNGVNYYHESIFKFDCVRYPVSEAGEADINDCNCIYEDKAGNWWIGTNGNGLLCYDRKTGTYRKYQHDPADPSSISSNVVVSLAGDGDGKLWVGTYVGGLDCFDGKRFYHYPVKSGGSGGLSANSVYCLYLDTAAATLWAGTLGGGLDCLDLQTGQWRHFRQGGEAGSLISDYIYSLSRGKDNELLIGTSLGVNLLDLQTGGISLFRGTRRGDQEFFDKAINLVFRDSRGLLWIGSNSGLSIYDPEGDRLYQLDKVSGLPDDNCMSIQEDEARFLWLGTKNGLLRVAPRRTTEGTYRFDCTAFYEDEGIPGRVFNRNSVCRSVKGELIFGGTNGLTVFNPSRIRYNDYPPQALITGLWVRNERMEVGREHDGRILLKEDISYSKELILKYDERNFTFSISASSYFLPGKNSFSYRMKGFDKDWTTTDAQNRNVTYTNLSPGTYTFEVKAKNNDGVWSETPTTLRVVIQPPFWGTVWAIALYVFVFTGTVYGIVKILVRNQKKKLREEQEKVVSRRLHEMDEMKLRFFTNVSHEFRTPLALIITPLEKLIKGETEAENRKILQLIYRNANQLLQLVNQLLDFRKIDVQGERLLLSVGDIVMFIRNITYSFKELSEQRHIRFSFASSFASFMMKFDTDKVFKIVSNLLSNAFKFTPEGGEVSVTLTLQPIKNGQDMFMIRVADTGIGIDADKCERIFDRFYQISSEANGTVKGTGIGLHLCREYVRLHNGTISVKSEPGKGSVFTVLLPAELPDLQEVIANPVRFDIPAVPETVLPIEETEEEESRPGKPLLVLVDDNPDFLEFMKLSLCEPFRVLTASDGEQAWRLILEKLPDIVVSDVMMPVTDGIVLCQRVKQDIRTSHIPVILLTAKSADNNKVTGLEAGADDYIGKPFNMDILLLKIRHLVEVRQQLQAKFRNASHEGIPLTDIAISSLDEELMRKAIKYIEDQLADPELSVERLSREMGMSRVNFYKKSLAITGKTPVELIRTVRMKRAAVLLERSQLRVNEVAREVGLNEIKLFRKYFKEEFGILPSEYLEQKKASNR